MLYKNRNSNFEVVYFRMTYACTRMTINEASRQKLKGGRIFEEIIRFWLSSLRWVQERELRVLQATWSRSRCHRHFSSPVFLQLRFGILMGGRSTLLKIKYFYN